MPDNIKKMTVACLSGKDISSLLEGNKIYVGDVEFVYDGTNMEQIEQSIVTFKDIAIKTSEVEEIK